MSAITEKVTELAEPIVKRHGCELWDVEYVKEAGDWYLRVYIDREDGVSIDHCEAVSRDLDPILDEHENLIPGSYTFEVSSAGAERQLRRPSDFPPFIGRYVEISLYQSKNGQKAFFGNLLSYKDGDIELDEAGIHHHFKKSEIAGVWLRISMNNE
ncbi:MAG: ribosome maturation factor RimP [Oscillospiraceae bacterium]|nr:ribosome maturation factor RimP [Oscillospiraceae bacterium]